MLARPVLRVEHRAVLRVESKTDVEVAVRFRTRAFNRPGHTHTILNDLKPILRLREPARVARIHMTPKGVIAKNTKRMGRSDGCNGSCSGRYSMYTMLGFCNCMMPGFCNCIRPHSHRCRYREGKEKPIVPFVSHRST